LIEFDSRREALRHASMVFGAEVSIKLTRRRPACGVDRRKRLVMVLGAIATSLRATRTRAWSLTALAGPQIGRVIPLCKPLLIGRDPHSRLLLEDPMVSRRHATVTTDELGHPTVADHGSLNGTWVND
jgi:FHA domain